MMSPRSVVGPNVLGSRPAQEQEPATAIQATALRAPFNFDSKARGPSATGIREISTAPPAKDAPTDERAADGRAGRIEIVEWAGSESSIDQNSGSQSVSLTNLMQGSTGSGGTNDSQLTIDNLWKVLASEKASDSSVISAPGSDASDTTRSAAQLASQAHRQGHPAGAIREKFQDHGDSESNYGRPSCHQEPHAASLATTAKPDGAQPTPNSHIFATPCRRSHNLVAAPLEQSLQGASRGQVSPLRFSRENHLSAAALRGYCQEKQEEGYMYGTP